jgi:ATP:corrinoid adenosyltransferase
MGMADPLSYQLSFTYAISSVDPSPLAVAVGDFTNDGNMDIVTANSGRTVSVLLGNGNGTFTAATGSPYPVGSVPRAVAVGDFTGDGNLDIVTANYNDGTVSVLLGNGNGTFTAATGSPYSVGLSNGYTQRTNAVAVGDFTGDGNLDIVTANDGTGSGTVSVLLGNGKGAFTAATGSPYPVDPVVGSLTAVAVGDFTGDGNLDIVTADFNYDNNDGTGTVSVLLGNGKGAFTVATGSPYPVGGGPRGVAVGDFNHDGNLDIVTANFDDGTVSVLLGNGKGAFTAATGSPYPVGGGPRGVAVGDFNHDGNLDIVTANGDGTVSVWLGNGKGTFTTKRTFTVGTSSASGTSSFPAAAAGDFTNDGYLDGIVFTVTNTNTVTVLLQPPPPLDVQVNTIQIAATAPFDGAVAMITETFSASDTTATIDWGDGTLPTSGEVSANADGTLTVSGNHTFLNSGTHRLSVTAYEGIRWGVGDGQAIVQPATGV